MLRKEEARNRRSQARTVVISIQRVPMTRGASLRSRVKGNFQARFWSSGGRGDSPTDCRKLSVSVLLVTLESVYDTIGSYNRVKPKHRAPDRYRLSITRHCWRMCVGSRSRR